MEIASWSHTDSLHHHTKGQIHLLLCNLPVAASYYLKLHENLIKWKMLPTACWLMVSLNGRQDVRGGRSVRCLCLCLCKEKRTEAHRKLPADPWDLTYCRKRTLLPPTPRICIESCIRQVDPTTCVCSLHLCIYKKYNRSQPQK